MGVETPRSHRFLSWGDTNPETLVARFEQTGETVRCWIQARQLLTLGALVISKTHLCFLVDGLLSEADRDSWALDLIDDVRSAEVLERHWLQIDLRGEPDQTFEVYRQDGERFIAALNSNGSPGW